MLPKYFAYYPIFVIPNQCVMPTVQEVMELLEEHGNEGTKKVLMRHGAREPFFGVKVGDMKSIMKTLKVKKDHQLSLDLYQTGNSDAMYLAGLIADEKQISAAQLEAWINGAYWYMISEYTVAWVAAESPWGEQLGMQWIDSTVDNIAAAGWATLSSVLQLRPNAEINLDWCEKLLDRVANKIKNAQNREKYAMNGFIITLGTQVPEFTEKCIALAEALGAIEVNMGGTSCKVPDAGEYIFKAQEKGKIAQKKKTVRC
jgi:3-methyladenine DNA glycosylase AlkD